MLILEFLKLGVASWIFSWSQQTVINGRQFTSPVNCMYCCEQTDIFSSNIEIPWWETYMPCIEATKFPHFFLIHWPESRVMRKLNLWIGWSIEGLHDTVRTFARTKIQNLLVSFCTAPYGEKQQKTLELSILLYGRIWNFIRVCVCVLILLSLSC